MSYAYDPTTASGQVRLLATDTDATRQIFSDDEIAAFLSMMNEEVLLAGALAVETIATNEVLVEKAISILGLSVNGPALAKSLMARAERIREAYHRYQADGSAWGWAEFADGVFQDTEHIFKTYLREFAGGLDSGSG